jgi:hypothetical protein
LDDFRPPRLDRQVANLLLAELKRLPGLRRVKLAIDVREVVAIEPFLVHGLARPQTPLSATDDISSKPGGTGKLCLPMHGGGGDVVESILFQIGRGQLRQQHLAADAVGFL